MSSSSSSAFDSNTWYILQNRLQNENNTLTAANNTQSAFNPNSPSAIYFAALAQDVSYSQQWQVYPVASGSSSAYILRNRQIGASAYLTTALTTRKCGGGLCATVPVLAPTINNESLWNFGDWGFSDSIGGATIYNLGNTSSWRLDAMLGGPATEMLNSTDTGGGGQHWFFNSHEPLAASESSSFATIPTTATALLAQFTGAGTTVTPSIQANPSAVTTTTPGGTGVNNSGSGTANASSGSSGLSSGAAAGIGVGVAIGVLAILLAIFFLFRRRKQQTRRSTSTAAEMSSTKPGSGFSTFYSGRTNPDSDTSTIVTGRGPVLKAEMQSPSQSSRVELYSPPGGVQEVPAYEMPHPSVSPRMEMEHPSATVSNIGEGTHSSKYSGKGGSEKGLNMI